MFLAQKRDIAPQILFCVMCISSCTIKSLLISPSTGLPLLATLALWTKLSAGTGLLYVPWPILCVSETVAQILRCMGIRGLGRSNQWQSHF